MSTYITFDWVVDPQRVANDFFRAAREAEDMSDPMLLSKQIAIADMRERFVTQTDPDGAKWKEWSEAYAPVALATNFGAILERWYGLYRGAVSEDSWDIIGDTLFFDTGGLPEYGIWHQTGKTRIVSNSKGEAYKSELPQRRFIGPSLEAQEKIVQVFDQWFDGIVDIVATGGGRKLGRRYKVRGGNPANIGQFSKQFAASN